MNEHIESAKSMLKEEIERADEPERDAMENILAELEAVESKDTVTVCGSCGCQAMQRTGGILVCGECYTFITGRLAESKVSVSPELQGKQGKPFSATGSEFLAKEFEQGQSKPEPTEFTKNMREELARMGDAGFHRYSGLLHEAIAHIESQADEIKQYQELYETMKKQVARLEEQREEIFRLNDKCVEMRRARDKEIERLTIDKYRLVTPSYMWGMLERGEIAKEQLDKWFEQALKRE